MSTATSNSTDDGTQRADEKMQTKNNIYKKGKKVIKERVRTNKCPRERPRQQR